MPGLFDDVENFLRQTDRVANPVEGAVKVGEDVASEVARVGGEAYSNLQPAREVGNTLAAANELESILKLSNGLNAVTAVASLVQVKHWLESLTLRLPPVIGRPLYRIVRDMIFPLETLISDTANSVASNSQQLLNHHVHFTGWAAEQSGLLAKAYQYAFGQAPTAPGNVGPTPQNLAIAQLQGRINVLQQDVSRLKYEISVAQQPEVITVTYGAQVRELQKDVAALKQDVTNLDNKIERLTAPIPVIQGDLGRLQSQLTGLRAIQVGWTDVVQEIQRLDSRISATLSTIQPQITHQEHQIAQLQPLALLLQPGMTGLRVLRQLEDTPCLCPKLPDIDQMAVDALSVMLFVENG